MRELNAGMLKDFGLNIKKYHREFGAYLCETDQGIYLVKSVDYSEREMKCAHAAKEHLKAAGMYDIDGYALYSDGQPWAMINREKIAVRRWLQGEEADPEQVQDCCRLGKALAKLHLYCQGLELPEDCPLIPRYNELPERLERQIRRVRSMGKNIRRRGRLEEFDLLFLKTMRLYEESANAAVAGLRDGCMETVAGWAAKEKMFCHGEFSNHSVLFSGEEMLIHGFEEIRLAPPVMDLARLMEKVLRKNCWRSEGALQLLEAYENLRKLCSEEKRILYYYLLFPKRAWELAADGYGRRSQWVPALYRDKLEELIGLSEEREDALEQIKMILL